MSDTTDSTPTAESGRIESLDVLRGFALLGILLLNIIGFGLLSSSYSNPGFDLQSGSWLNGATWMSIELFAEGAMRCLFSILFGAGVVLFTSSKSGWIHYRRTFWLLMFGLFNAYILLWQGDILVIYALVGAVLYLVRNQSPKALLIFAGSLLVLMSLQHLLMGAGIKQTYLASERVVEAQSNGETPSEQDQELSAAWHEFLSDYQPPIEEQQEELEARTGSYLSALTWVTEINAGTYSFVVPLFLFWDALAMMLIGMALYKTGVLQATRDKSFYIKLMIGGFLVGLTVNGYEVSRAYSSGFDIFSTFAQMQWTYHFGRLGMALGYMGLLVLICQSGMLTAITSRLAAVGRMALTNYLSHSLICAVIFTGLGFGLLEQLERVELYGVVIAIWIFQMWFSPLWLKHYRFGPVEWLWRALTYGTTPHFKR